MSEYEYEQLPITVKSYERRWGRKDRLFVVNQFIKVIASCGRKYFRFEDRVAWIERDSRGLLFLHNEFNQKRIYISKYGAWKGFHHGGTLHSLVWHLVEFIKLGKKLPVGIFAPRWAYGDDMQKVIQSGIDLGIIIQA